VDLGRHLLHLAEKEVTLQNLGQLPTSSRLFLVSDEMIPARYEREVMERLEAPKGAAIVLVEPSRKTSRERARGEASM
jgi:hypothetical protein